MAGADSEDEAYQLYLDSKEILGHGSFNLRKFRSNLLSLQGRLDQSEAPMMTSPAAAIVPSKESYSEATIPAGPVGQPGEHKVLGVRWEPAEDLLIFDLAHLAERAVRIQPTKRNVVSVIGQIYDPLGFLSPITIAFKILMQEVCKTKLGWDQPLTGDTLVKWNDWSEPYSKASRFRCLGVTLTSQPMGQCVSTGFVTPLWLHTLLSCT